MKHYIRLEGANIVKGFSDAFEQPLEGDICVNEDGGRHYNPSLFDDMCPKFKYIEQTRILKEEEVVIEETVEVNEDGEEVITEIEVIIPAELETFMSIEDLTEEDKADWRIINIKPVMKTQLDSEIIQAMLKANTLEELKEELIRSIYIVEEV